MKIIKAEDYGITNGKEIGAELAEMLKIIAETDEEKTVEFEKGTYFIDSSKCKQYMLIITNTVGEKEFKPDEKSHLNAVPFYFSGVSNLVFDGNDSVFIIDGKVTNVAFEDCQNIEFKNLEIRHAHPDMHELKVAAKTAFSVDFEIDKDSSYEVKDKKLRFFGKDFRYVAGNSIKFDRWIGLIKKETPDKVERVLHPLAYSLGVKDLGNGKIRAKYFSTSRFEVGNRYYIYDVRRQFAGIFVNRCKNIALKNIKQRFNYSLALVAQDSENITAEELDFSPEKGSVRKMASVADFVQLCMCRGKITIKNSFFEGAGDDCLNVHGVHFKIVDKHEDEITVRFMHPQTFGFNPLRVGDKIAFIDIQTLLEIGTALIKSSELINDYDIKLKLDSTENAKTGMAVEDVDACPELDFENNTVSRIITRGLLVTTRRKVNIENNHFISNSMSGILLSDDAKNWYESGMCRDVTIKNNIFDYCGQTPILIKPENAKHAGAVHKNIKIIKNEFKNYTGVCVDAKSTDNIILKGNKFSQKKVIKTNNCTNVEQEE